MSQSSKPCHSEKKSFACSRIEYLIYYRGVYFISYLCQIRKKMLTQTLLLFGHRNEKDVFFCSVLNLEPVKGELG